MNEVIKFVTHNYGLTQMQDCLPKPMKNYIPQWFKNIPTDKTATVKNCPSFPDYFSLGYVIPMWVDSKLSFDKESDLYRTNQATSELGDFGIHANSQFIDYVTPSFNGIESQFVFKTNCPWKIITPPGWSVLQLPLFYNFNQEYSVLPGVIDTDIHYDINQQILYHGNGTEILIKRGDPLAVYIPFERKKIKYEVRQVNDDDEKRLYKSYLDRVSRFFLTGSYRKMQRERDKNVR